MANTLWCSSTKDNLWLTSGSFSSTIKASLPVGSIEAVPTGVDYNGTDTIWTGWWDDKLYKTSGLFTSTLKTSEDIKSTDDSAGGISYNGEGNVLWCGGINDKIYIQSGQFTSTVKDSLPIGTPPTGCTYDGTDTYLQTDGNDKLTRFSGQFTGTVKDSEIVQSIDNGSNDITFDGTDTLWPGNTANKLYKTSGNFTSTIKTSEYIGGLDTGISGIGTDDPATRLDLHTLVLAEELTIGLSPLAVAIGTDTMLVYPSEITLGLTLNAPMVITAPVLDFETITDSQLSLNCHVPTINVTNDIRILVTNTRNFAISEYSNFGFNSMCKFNGKYLYAKSDGIYEDGAGNDNGTQIDASYKTGSIDIYATEIQRLRDGFLTIRSDGDIQLFSVGDEVNTRTYTILLSTAQTIHERRVKFERGIKDRHFNFGVSNVNGSTLEVDSIKILSEPIRKRR